MQFVYINPYHVILILNKSNFFAFYCLFFFFTIIPVMAFDYVYCAIIIIIIIKL